MRFRPDQHLRRQNDIRTVRAQGRRLECKPFTVWWRTRSDAEPAAGPRLCVAASIAAVGPAVQRNRAKRRVREIFRRHQDLLPPSCDLLIVVRSAVNRRPFPELERNFVEACEKIGSFRPLP
jgi:ribonuclease P protein component